MQDKNNKLLVIVGPTATGKTKLAVKLARLFNGEIVSADSRQVYKGMDVGTGKDLSDFTFAPGESIPYHCIDIVSPRTDFNAAKYLKCARKAIDDIIKRDKLPILAGGSGLYFQSLVDGYDFSHIAPDKTLRNRLEKKSVVELQQTLKKLDPSLQGIITNKRYLIRYIEILSSSPKSLHEALHKQGSGYNCLVIGMKMPREQIIKKIDRRLIERLHHENMVQEVYDLHYKDKISWKRLESFGLEYKFISQYLQNKLTESQMIGKLAIAIHQFAKRQMSWLRRWERQGQKINWVSTHAEAKNLLRNWLK